MPTVFIHNGYRVSFYSYDLAERMHVHVFKSGGWSRNAAQKSSNDGLNMGAMRIRVLL
ncbi:MAG: hypothetical protein WBN75_07520 [Verrucomicrobiia bacterium]|jgi:hypothetical protein